MIIVGIDPGEAWCGFAALWVSKRAIHAEARTYSTEGRTRQQVVDTLLPFQASERVIVACENYQFRPVGHQRFSSGDTVRLIGALEYVAMTNGWPWHLVPPGPWKRELPMLFGPFVAEYREQWPDARHPSWDHCLSAWRVLGRYLLTNQLTSVLSPLRRESSQGDAWDIASSRLLVRRRRYDLIAPAVRHEWASKSAIHARPTQGA